MAEDAQSGAEVGGEVGGSAGAAGSESFVEAMNRHAEGEDWGNNQPESPDVAEEAVPDGGSEEAPKQPQAAAAGDSELSLEELRALAEKHGYKFTDEAVTPAERAAFREAKRKKEEEWRRQEAELQSKWRDEEGKHKSVLERVDQFKAAEEAGDLDGMAKALGHENWEKLQEVALARMTDPNYKELQELKRKVAAQEEREKRISEERKQQEKAREQQEVEQRYLQSLSGEMKGAGGALEALSDDAAIVNSIMQIQRANWDEELEQTISPDKALEWKNPQTGKSLKDNLLAIRDRVNQAWPSSSSDDPSKKTNGKAQTAKPKAPKTGVVSASERSGATTRAPWKKEDDDKFLAHFRQRISEAAFEEESAKYKSRA